MYVHRILGISIFYLEVMSARIDKYIWVTLILINILHPMNHVGISVQVYTLLSY